jgi:tetrahydromethanopterin S-methyltransferase subunit E
VKNALAHHWNIVTTTLGRVVGYAHMVTLDRTAFLVVATLVLGRPVILAMVAVLVACLATQGHFALKVTL